MALVTRDVVTLESGVLAVVVRVDGEYYTMLISDIVPHSVADKKQFSHYVLEVEASYKPDDYADIDRVKGRC